MIIKITINKNNLTNIIKYNNNNEKKSKSKRTFLKDLIP